MVHFDCVLSFSGTDSDRVTIAWLPFTATNTSAVDKYLSYITIENVFVIQEDNVVNVSIEFSVSLEEDEIEILNFDFRIGD